MASKLVFGFQKLFQRNWFRIGRDLELGKWTAEIKAIRGIVLLSARASGSQALAHQFPDGFAERDIANMRDIPGNSIDVVREINCCPHDDINIMMIIAS